MGPWIRTDTELPPEGVWVLIRHDDGATEVAKRYATGFYDTSAEELEEVYAWKYWDDMSELEDFSE